MPRRPAVPAAAPRDRNAPRLDAERALLGAALSAPWVLDEVGEIDPATWFRPQHAALWDHFRALRTEHPTVTAGWHEICLLAAWDWPDVDGPAYVATLANDAPSAEIAAYAIRHMRRSWLADGCRTVGLALVDAIDRGDDIDAVIESHREAMRGLLRNRSAR